MTPETAGALFNRASWFRWQGKNEAGKVDITDPCAYPKRVDVQLLSGQFVVKIAEPVIVLFEWHSSGGESTSGNSLFHTGFLLLDATFADKQAAPELEDLMYFNELFRYWRRPFKTHGKKMADFFCRQSKDDEKLCQELYLERWLNLLELPLHDKREKWWTLFPVTGKENWGKNIRHWWRKEICAEPSSSKHRSYCDDRYIAYMDNRAFVWTCALLPRGLNDLRSSYPIDTPDERIGQWVKLLNVDRPYSLAPVVCPSNYEAEWCRDRTYSRWSDYGTVYGFNYHSGAMLSTPMEDPPTWSHFSEMYFDMVLMLLYLRISLFRFSGRIAEVSEEARRRGDKGDGWLRERFEELRREFALLTNLYQFPLISNQQQAIEMYAMAREQMDVAELYDEVSHEINSTHELLEVTVASRVQRRADVLANVGVPAALTALLLTVFTITSEWKLSLLESWAPTVKEGGTLLVHIPAQIIVAALFFLFLWLGFTVGLLRRIARFWRRTSGLD